jgi:WD40 repeat protein
MVVTSGINGLLWFWDVQSGEQKFSLDNSEKIYTMTTSPAQAMVAAGLNGKIKVWDTNMQEEITELQQAGDVSSLAFNQNGSLLATGSSEGTVILWKMDGNDFTQMGNTLHLNGYPRFLAFSPDDKWLAGGGSTSFAYLWDINTVQETARIPHGNPVTSVSFSPDGTQLFTVSRKVVRIWDISLISLILKEELVPNACSHLATNLSREDWINYFADEEYRLICPSLLEEE